MTQSQTQTAPTAAVAAETAPVKTNSLAALDKKVADGIAADKVAAQPQAQMQTVNAPQMGQTPAVAANGSAQMGDAPVVKS